MQWAQRNLQMKLAPLCSSLHEWSDIHLILLGLVRNLLRATVIELMTEAAIVKHWHLRIAALRPKVRLAFSLLSLGGRFGTTDARRECTEVRVRATDVQT